MKSSPVFNEFTLPLSSEESARIATLHSYHVLDTPPEKELDALTQLAAYICNCPVSLISLIDTNRQWIKSKYGIDVTETIREVAFCQHTIKSNDLLEVCDAKEDHRFFNNPHVVGDPHIQYYCGMPLITPEGHRLGALCVVNYIPNQLTETQKQALQTLAGEVMTRLELNRQKKQLELEKQRLAESENRYRQLIENIEGFIFTHDENGVIMSINQKVASALGCSPQQMIGKRLDTFLAKEVKSNFNAYLSQFTHANVVSGVLHVCAAGQKEMFWIYKNFKYQDGKNKPYIICSAQDITEKELARQLLQKTRDELETTVQLRTSELERTNTTLEKTRAELDMFVYRASHDLLGPLCSLKGLLTIAQLQQNQPASQPDYFALMCQTVNKLDHMLNGLLTYSNNTHFSLEYKPLDIEPLIWGEFEACKHISGYNRISLTTHVDMQHPFFSDEERVRIIFKSLLSNSIIFQNPANTESVVYISVTCNSKQAVIHMQDNGVGISQNAMPHVFNMFSKSAAHSRGPGLGLFIVKEVLKKLNGHIHVESQEGKGTTFTLVIPNQVNPQENV